MTSDRKSIHVLIKGHRERFKTPRELGTSFEKLIKSYLSIDPQYAAIFAQVWMWNEWPEKWGPDCGIDLVARTHHGDYVAVQCKFFEATHQIKKEDIDSFFTESGKTFKINGVKHNFSGRIIVSTTSLWSENAERSIHNQTIETLRIDLETLAQSPIDWSKFSLERPTELDLKPKKKLRAHQSEAIENIVKGFKANDRGKLIMACGTGKTLTSLRLAEQHTKSKGKILFLVPSISLMSQTLREWTAEAEKTIVAYAVCSDSKVGKSEDMSRNDLAIPANTNASSLAKAMASQESTAGMTVVFATYHSIKVVSDAQKKGAPEFDLIICDEAHRTTGFTLEGDDESHFVKVHDKKFLRGKKRLYMTATPRLYGESAKLKAEEAGAEICSMDDDNFGPEFHRLGFGEAVSKGLLSDYKVLVLAVDERHVSKTIQKTFKTEDGELVLNDLVKIIGCWNGLSKQFTGEEAANEDRQPMKRAVAFAQKIKDSQKVAKIFQDVVKDYIANSPAKSDSTLKCDVEHVDGTFNVLERNKKLEWLKTDAPENTCRILSNARCLSEGVDVPALDAVIFLNPRDSQVDVVQSVGRIMRQSPGKKYGYVILPIGIPAGVPPEEALKDNKKYKVVWQVLQALRSHDDRFNALINQIDLNNTRPGQISIVGVGGGVEESEKGGDGKNSGNAQPKGFAFPEVEEWKDAIYAKIVIKCGSRVYWEQWAGDVAKIAQEHVGQIKAALKSKKSPIRTDFELFLNATRASINSAVTEDAAIEMLAQHLVTKPIFDALFEHYEFTKYNPVSIAMQGVLKGLEREIVQKDSTKLHAFYDSVRKKVTGINNLEGRQRVIVELYERFFKVAFPKDAERLGIVYTPVEVVDFIIKSVDAVMKSYFKRSISDAGVQVLDPFTGTGTFLVRLLQSGLIKPGDLKRKFGTELHANELVLLAYYIAAINIEETYHALSGGKYQPFKGIILTDTFQTTEAGGRVAVTSTTSENDRRLARQKSSRINIVIGNPPYSVGQGDANDNNQNLKYATLDTRIRDTYAAESVAVNKNSLYDSYIRAIRWSTDRLGESGIIGFVTNAGFLDTNSADGLRKVFGKEFAKIYCFNLRGNARTQGEQRRKERGNIFGEGSRTPVAITIFIKDAAHRGPCEILYHDIGDYLTRDEKLAKVETFGSIAGIEDWQKILPNAEGDWISQRDASFEKFLLLGAKGEGSEQGIFVIYSGGVKTNRDAWAYNFSKVLLTKNIKSLIAVYGVEVVRLASMRNRDDFDDLLASDPKKINWNHSLRKDAKLGKDLTFDTGSVRTGLYRPFTKAVLYKNRRLNDRVYLMPRLFPTAKHENIVIAVTGAGSQKNFSCLVSNVIPDLEHISKSQCFPLYYYDHIDDLDDGERKVAKKVADKDGYIRRSGISAEGLRLFQSTYGDQTITGEDLFYYIYGVLHSSDYRNRFQNDLKKMLPRIPYLSDFRGFSKSGRELAKWHLNYETVKPFKLKEETLGAVKDKNVLYRVTDMKHPKSGKNPDKTVIIFNSKVKISGIPLDAYDYVVNGKPALDWIMERYAVTVDKESGIKNDPNDWSDDPRYIIDLIGRVVAVSRETNRIVKNLPAFELLVAKA